MTTTYNIAIDGPAGAGKSTIAKLTARKLGFVYVDTGAMYRAMALYFLRKGIAADDEASVNAACEEITVSISMENGEQQVFLNGENVNGLIRTEEVGKMTSATSIYRKVREKLTDLQRSMAQTTDLIMDGRDIGTVVLPNADVKIFLTASPECRAERRYKELIEKGESVTFEAVLADVNQRDYQDSHREIAPMKPCEDSVMADTTGKTLEESTEMIIKIIKGE